MENKIKFKHQRFNIIQAIYGELDEDASLLAVKETEKRIDKLFEEIEDASSKNDNFGDSHAIEICYKNALTIEELIIFIHKVSRESACPQHPFIQMIQHKLPPRGDE